MPSTSRAARACAVLAPHDQRHGDIVQRREFRQQMVELIDEAQALVAQRALARSDRPTASLPSTETEPLDGTSNRPRMCSSVLLPEPEAPTMATISPRATVRLTLFSTSMRAGPSS